MTPDAPVPRLVMPVGSRDHIRGPEDAPVTLVEYGDYECPDCGFAYPIVKSIQKRIGERLRFVFRNFPLIEAHPNSENAAEVAEAAGAKGKFWQMHDVLFDNQEALEPPDLMGYATRLGLDAKELASELHSHAYAARVHEDFLSGARSGVNGTPTFYVNGARFDGLWERGQLFAAIEAAIEAWVEEST